MPLANTYTLLEKITLSAPQSQVTFMTTGNISSNYTDLVVVMSVRSSTTSGASNLLMWMNGTTGTSYSYYQGFGDGNGNQTRTVLANQPWFELSPSIPNANGSFTASTFANCQVWIQDYRRADGEGTAINSLFYSESNVTTVTTGAVTGTFFNGSNPITSITIDGTDNFVAGSTFYLYGIANLTKQNTGPSATGGNIIGTDGTYFYHIFTSSGVFTPSKNLTCDYLVIAGGGGGISGGGGAGGLRSTVTATGGGGSLESPLSLTAQAYTVTVGAGGTGGTSGLNPDATNGNNSVFSTITAIGGGKGGRQSADLTAGNGGSGGGGGRNTTNGGTGTTNQGYAGGAGSITLSGLPAGGGGGAGAIGGAATSGQSGSGGNGVAVAITGSSVTYAGGGGGAGDVGCAAGNGGSGGGGAGNATVQGTAGTANTGGGGGGGYNAGGSTPQGANGGSGVVIVRYAV